MRKLLFTWCLVNFYINVYLVTSTFPVSLLPPSDFAHFVQEKQDACIDDYHPYIFKLL